MVRIRYILLLSSLLLVTGCHVWTNYDEDAESAECWVECETSPWWDDAYPFRLPIRSLADSDGDHPIVLPIVLDPVELEVGLAREDGDDLRVVVNGEEVGRELVRLADDRVAVWSRFPTAPSRDDVIHLYWGDPNATLPPAPWADHVGAFHFEEDYESSVPEGEKFRGIEDPVLVPDGRIGGGVAIPSWPGSVRMYDGNFFVEGASTFSFSFRGRRAEDDDRAVMVLPSPCDVVEVRRTATRATEVAWSDSLTCTGEDDPETTASLPVDLMDGAWHDVVVSVDQAADTLSIAVDDVWASVPIAGGGPVESGVHLRGGEMDDPPGLYVFDEARFSSFARGESEMLHATRAMRGELFELASVEER